MAGWLGRNVLVVSPTPTAPVDFGNRRYILNSFKRLQEQGARIIFLYYPAEHDWRHAVPEGSLRIMQEQWDEFHLVPVTRPLHTEPEGSHHGIDEWWDDAIGGMLTWIFATHRIDACIVNYTWLTRAFSFCPPGVLRILDTHDRFAGRKEMLEAHGIRPEFFYLTDETEREALQRCDLIWAIKEDEARSFRDLTGRPTLVFPHVERPELAYRCRVPREAILRFGFFAARNAVNTTNYRRFFRLLESEVKRRLLPGRFILAGSMCDLVDDNEFRFLERLGTVESVESFYSACDVVVVPMAFSTGLKIKVGEALGYGKAVIAHAHAFDGYEPHHRFQALPSDEAMVAAMISLIDAPGQVDDMERAALRSARAAEAVAEHCVQHSIRSSLGNSNTGRRGFVVVVPADLLTQPQVLDHLSEVCGYVKFIERPAIYVTGDARDVPAAAWQQLALHADLYAQPLADMDARWSIAVGTLSFEDAEAFRATGIAVLYALRCDADLAVWQKRSRETLLRLEDWGREPGLEIRRSAAALRMLPDRDRQGLCSLGTGAAERQLRLAGVDLPHIRVPLLRDAATSTLVPFLCAQERVGVCLLGCGADPSVLRALLSSPAFRTRWGGNRRMVVLSAAEQDTLDPTLLEGSDIVRPPALLARFRTLARVPTLIVQLGDDQGHFSWLREISARAALPYISLAPDQLGDGVAANSGARITPAGSRAWRARQALHVLDAITSTDFVEREKQALLQFWPFGADSGWAWLWRTVSDQRAA